MSTPPPMSPLAPDRISIHSQASSVSSRIGTALKRLTRQVSLRQSTPLSKPVMPQDPAIVDALFEKCLIGLMGAERGVEEATKLKQRLSIEQRWEMVQQQQSSLKSSPSRPHLVLNGDLSPSEMMNRLQSLRISLTNEPVSWIETFLEREAGIKQLITFLDYDLNLACRLELLRGIKSLANNKVGLEALMGSPDLLGRLLDCLGSSRTEIRLGVIGVLTVVAHLDPALLLSLRNDEPRFASFKRHLETDLRTQNNESLFTDELLFVEAMLQHEQVEVRMALRQELLPSPSLLRQLKGGKVAYRIGEKLLAQAAADAQSAAVPDEDASLEERVIDLLESMEGDKDPLAQLISALLRQSPSGPVRRRWIEWLTGQLDGLWLEAAGLPPQWQRCPCIGRDRVEKAAAWDVERLQLQKQLETAQAHLQSLQSSFRSAESLWTERLTSIKQEGKQREEQLTTEVKRLQSQILELESQAKQLATDLDQKQLEQLKITSEASETERRDKAPDTTQPSVPSAAKSIPPPPPLPAKSIPPPPTGPRTFETGPRTSVPPPPPPLPSPRNSVTPSEPPTPLSSVSGIPPPPPPPPGPRLSVPNGPPPPPPAPRMSMPGSPPPVLPAPTVKLRPLPWEKLVAAPDALKNSVWSELTEWHKLVDRIDLLRVDQLFEWSESKKLGNKDQGNWLETRDANNLSICLKGKHLTAEAVVNAIQGLDEVVIDHQLVKMLLTIGGKLASSKAPPSVQQNDAEALMCNILSIPFWGARLQWIDARQAYYETTVELTKLIEPFQVALKALRSSSELKRILELILFLGNYLNQGTPRGNARAFQLHSLNLLKTCKTTSPEITALNYLHELLKRTFPDLLIVTRLVDALGRAKAQPFKEMDETMLRLREIVSNMIAIKEALHEEALSISVIANTASRDCQQLEEEVKAVHASFVDLKRYYLLEEAADGQVVFGLFRDFLHDLQLAELVVLTPNNSRPRDAKLKEVAEKAGGERCLVDGLLERLRNTQ